MTPELWIALAVILPLLLAAGFFSAAETALSAASRPRMQQMAQEGDRRAALAKRLQEQRDVTAGALRLGRYLASIGAAALAAAGLFEVFGDVGIVYAAVAMTALVLVFSDVMPRTFAGARADDAALALAPAAHVAVAVLKPPVLAVAAIVRGVSRLFGATLPEERPDDAIEEELREVIDLHAGPEPEQRHERAMLRGVLDLDQVTVGKVMTHRRRVITVDADDPPRAIVDQVLASGHQRLPLTRGQPDNIVGVISAASLMREVMQRGRALEGLDVLALADKPWFVPESTTLYDQLQAFRRRGQGPALVVDEYGALMGVVSLGDIVAEIVGDIDERREAPSDSPLAGVRPATDGSYVIDGSVPLRDLNRELDWLLPDEHASTIAGLVLHEARLIPNVGQVFAFHGFRFEILRRHRNQITSLRVTPPKRAAA